MQDDLAGLLEQFEKIVSNNSDLYTSLNAFRDWFNKNIQNYELILDDEWFEDKTTIEYQLRCLDTFNIMPLAIDEYENEKDAKGVWHLGAYKRTVWLTDNPVECIQLFVNENKPLEHKTI